MDNIKLTPRKLSEMLESNFNYGIDVRKTKEGKNIGKLIFDESNIFKTSNKLDILIRTIFYKNHITHISFKDAVFEYGKKVGYDNKKTSSLKNNLLRTLNSGNITYGIFYNILHNILRYTICNMGITIAMDGKFITYNTTSETEVIDEVKE